MSDSGREYKDGHSVIWDKEAKFREQKWPQLRARIEATQGGVGVAADDFVEMLQYRPAPFHDKTQSLRNEFADLTRDATGPEDLDLLADILTYMLREPWSANLDGAWFIYYLEDQDSRDIDVVRAAGVLNRLHQGNAYAAQVLCETLSSYVYGDDEELVLDLILKTDRLSSSMIDSLKRVRLNPPRVGERHLISYPHVFLSYSRTDIQRMREIRSGLQNEGFNTWTDESLAPGTPEWQTTIETAIAESGGLVVLMTPDALTSVWVSREIDLALSFEKRIFPALVDGDAAIAVPPKLANIQRVDLRPDAPSGMQSLGNAIRKYLSSPASVTEETAK